MANGVNARAAHLTRPVVLVAEIGAFHGGICGRIRKDSRPIEPDGRLDAAAFHRNHQPIWRC